MKSDIQLLNKEQCIARHHWIVYLFSSASITILKWSRAINQVAVTRFAMLLSHDDGEAKFCNRYSRRAGALIRVGIYKRVSTSCYKRQILSGSLEYISLLTQSKIHDKCPSLS